MPRSKSSLGVNWQFCTEFTVSKHPSRFDPLINKQYLSLTPIKMNKKDTVPYPSVQKYARFIQMIYRILSSIWTPKKWTFHLENRCYYNCNKYADTLLTVMHPINISQINSFCLICSIFCVRTALVMQKWSYIVKLRDSSWLFVVILNISTIHPDC